MQETELDLCTSAEGPQVPSVPPQKSGIAAELNMIEHDGTSHYGRPWWTQLIAQSD